MVVSARLHIRVRKFSVASTLDAVGSVTLIALAKSSMTSPAPRANDPVNTGSGAMVVATMVQPLAQLSPSVPSALQSNRTLSTHSHWNWRRTDRNWR